MEEGGGGESRSVLVVHFPFSSILPILIPSRFYQLEGRE